MPGHNKLFFVFGKIDHWDIGRREHIWGFSPVQNWQSVLKDAGFGPGAEFLACVENTALFRGSVSASGVYFDDVTAPWGRDSKSGHVWPVRFRFEVLEDIDDKWFTGPKEDNATVLLSIIPRNLYTLREDAVDSPYLRKDIVFGGGSGAQSGEPLPRRTLPVLGPRFDPSQLTAPEDLEDAVADLFSLMGFQVTALGHTRPMEPCPDGKALLPPSLQRYYQEMGFSTFFLLWDCKFRVESSGLRVEERRKIVEYATEYAQGVKADAGISNYWFLLVGKDPRDAQAMRALAQRLSSEGDLQQRGCLGVRALHYKWLRDQVEELAMRPREKGIRDLEDRIRKL